MNPTTDRLDVPASDDPRLLHAAQEYLAELEAGRRPRRSEFVARYPDIAEALMPYLDALDMVHTSGPRLAPSGGKQASAEGPPAEPLGDFRIVREIGRGGMGIVYEAVQMSLGRRVALKVLPFAAALDAKQLRRFQNEAQAAAQLHHTNIVPVYAVGCERGVHYYAMQLIEGQNLADLIQQMRPQDGSGEQPRPASSAVVLPPTGPLEATPAPAPVSRTLSLTVAELSTQRATRSSGFYRTAARLMAHAAEALEHAHQLGVIHRDLKPANLMVDAQGNIWVTDFGLAQFHTGAGLTRTGDLLGTLRYMSPEQAAGQGAPLGPGTDVYSLGATLYELLTLEPLFGGADHQRLLHQILNDDPRPPRAVDPSVPPELDIIVLKAVNKNPAERYLTAQELADDLHRFLDNRPILARRPTLAQHVRKWARRHPAIVVSAIVLLFLATVGSLATAWLLGAEQERTQKALEGEQQRFQLARKSIDELIRVSEQELANRPDLEGMRRQLLNSALDYYQQLIELCSDDPGAKDELRKAKTKVETIVADLAALQGDHRRFLLRNPAVLTDLGLTAAQQTKVEDMWKSDSQQLDFFGPFHRHSSDERQQKFVELARAGDKAIHEILTEKQIARLQQIDYQRQGLHAFTDPDVVATLKLTAEQRKSILEIVGTTFMGGPPDHRGPGGPLGRRGPGGRPDHKGPDGPPDHNGLDGPPDDHKGPGGPQDHKGPDGPPSRRGPWGFPKMHEQNQQAVERIVAEILTVEQARRWKEMIGEPFREPMGFPPGDKPFGPPP